MAAAAAAVLGLAAHVVALLGRSVLGHSGCDGVLDLAARVVAVLGRSVLDQVALLLVGAAAVDGVKRAGSCAMTRHLRRWVLVVDKVSEVDERQRDVACDQLYRYRCLGSAGAQAHHEAQEAAWPGVVVVSMTTTQQTM